MKIKTFKDLIAWQKGMDLAQLVYQATRKMPKSELFALTNQMRRAATSVPMNIAEGFGRHTRPEFLHGLRIARGSLFELMTAFELATRLEMIPDSLPIRELLAEEDRVLEALIRSLEAKTKEEKKPAK